MKNSSKITLDCKNRKILFNGSCLEAGDLCKAMCCREWGVGITEKESKSFKYKIKPFCLLDNQSCKTLEISCMNRIFKLEKKKDGSCLYLNSGNRCSIYENRPLVCRKFSCRGGWKISAVARSPEQVNDKFKESTDKYIMGELSDDMKFILNPFIQLKVIFYVREIKKIYFIFKSFAKCRETTEQCYFDNPRINDRFLLHLISLFDGKNSLKDIHLDISKKYKSGLTKNNFYEIVGLLYQRNIIRFKNSLELRIENHNARKIYNI